MILGDYEKALHKFGDWGPLHAQADVSIKQERLVGDQLLAQIKDADVLVSVRDRQPMTASLLEQLPKLKYFIYTGPRNTKVDWAACKARNIPVSCTKIGDSKMSTAEIAWTLAMASTKRIVDQSALVQGGGWRNEFSLMPTLAGQRMGLIGLGSIGSIVARYANAFGMEVVAWSPNLTDERAAPYGAKRVELEELLKTSKIVSLHLVAVEATNGIINKERLAMMREDSILINTARASLIRTDDLVEAMKQDKPRPGQVALDVHDVEPPPKDYGLRNLPNVLLNPHTGFVSEESFARFSEGILENLAAWLAKEPLPNLVEQGPQ